MAEKINIYNCGLDSRFRGNDTVVIAGMTMKEDCDGWARYGELEILRCEETDVDFIGEIDRFFAVNDQCLPASIARHEALTDAMGLDRLGPMTGTSKRSSCARLGGFHHYRPLRAILPPRTTARSVPSIASMATIAFSLTTTVCPISNAAH